MEKKCLGEYVKGRSNNFDFVRFFVASLIIYFHAYPLSGQGWNYFQGWYPLGYTFDGHISVGDFFVAMFFVISGFLITQSWEKKPNLKDFFKKRALRLLPALTVVVAVTAFVVGGFFTSLPTGEYFRHPAVYAYLKNILLYETWFSLPGVFEGLPYPLSVNGSLWTMKYEARCYLLVAFLGVLNLFSYRKTLLYCYLAFFALLPLNILDITVTCYFFMGSLFYLFRDSIPLNGYFAGFSFAMIILSMYIQVGVVQTVLIYGTYLLFYFVFSPTFQFHNFGKYGDFSYGLYIYAFPIQQTVMYYLAPYHLSPIQYFLIQYPLVLGCAILSWNFLEKKCLGMK